MGLPIVDTLKNLVTGLGTSKDKTLGLGYAMQIIEDAELNAMHRTDWLARKIVDIIPNDMTREWRDWQSDNDDIELIEAVEKSPLINLQPKINLALQTARLLRGAVIYIGMKDNAPSEELDIERVGKGDLQYLHVLSRSEVTCGEIEQDVTSEYYGQPKTYTVTGRNGNQTTVHPSRMIRFIGAPILDARTSLNDGWGDSILQIVYDAVRNAGSAQAHVAALIPEAKTDVIYVPGLSKFLQNSTTTQQLTDRFTYANSIKSMFNMVLLEGNGANGDGALGEKWEQKQINFAQLPELMRQFLQIASGAADIPVTRLLGESPAGLNSTGKSDLQNYYDNIAARQRTELTPALHRLDEIIIRSATGERDPSTWYEWSPLWGLSDKEKADIFKLKADAARAIAGTGGASPSLMPIEALSDALVNAFVEDGSLPGLESAIEEFGRLADQEEDEIDLEATAVEPKQIAADAAPRTLYVHRKVLNAAEIIKWAKDQGFKTTLPADDLHVTITFSRTPVDWMAMGDNWSDNGKGGLTIPVGGPRLVEKFGDATVLLFASSALSWRHEDMKRQGASWDHPEYQPHVSISYKAGDLDLGAVEPYRGEIILGPEIFEEIDEGWSEKLEEN